MLRETGKLTSLLLAAAFFVSGLPAFSQAAVPMAGSVIRNVQWPDIEKDATKSILIRKDTSQVFRFDRPIVRAAISNPEICDITTVGDRDILINAKKAGIVNFLVWDEEDRIANFQVESTLDVDKLRKVLTDIDPGSHLNILPFNDTVAVYGTTKTSINLKQIEEASKAFDKKALSFVRLEEPKQILLEVRFAEINRTANKDFELDLETFPGFFTFRNLTGETGASTVDSTRSFVSGENAQTLTPLELATEAQANLFGSYISGSFLIQQYLKWLETKNILKVIARPNLVAKDGEDASFIVGGEFPVPIIADDQVQIDYKEFGTQLDFTPQVLEGEVIRLKVDAEVSELDFTSTVTSGGSTVPTILKRSYETIAELKDNQSLVIGGLITQKIRKINRKIPFLGDLPVISFLFNGENYSRTDVELLVVITPHVVKPFDLEEKKEFYKPGDVKEAVRIYGSPYPDEQGDHINRMITQGEAYRSQPSESHIEEKLTFWETKEVKRKAVEKKLKDPIDWSKYDYLKETPETPVAPKATAYREPERYELTPLPPRQDFDKKLAEFKQSRETLPPLDSGTASNNQGSFPGGWM